MMTFALAPSPKWYFLDAQGAPAAGGKINTFSSGDQTTPKFVFSDPSGMFPYLDPIILDATGGSPVPMYWETTTAGLYYIVVTDANDNIIFDLNNFPIAGGGGVTPITSSIDLGNHVINGAFLFIDAPTTADSLISPIPADSITRIAPASGFFNNGSGEYVPDLLNNLSGWIFAQKGGAGETSSIQFVDVAVLGQPFPINPSANATRYFSYSLQIAGSPQTAAFLYQTVPGVETFQNELLTVSFDIQSTANGVGSFEILQFYGIGGSASTSVSQNFNFVAGIGQWSRPMFQISVPNIIGKTKGINGDDSIQIIINFPINVIGTFNITNIQVQRGNFSAAPYIYQDYNQDQFKVLIDLMTFGNAIFPTGEVKWMSIAEGGTTPVPIPGWIFIESVLQTLGSLSSGASYAGIQFQNLYSQWWNSFPQSECIVSGGRGLTAAADFGANKQMTVPQHILGTSLVGAGVSLFANTPFATFTPNGFSGIGTGNFYLFLYVKI